MTLGAAGPAVERAADPARRRLPPRPVIALAASTTAGYGVLLYAYGVLLAPMGRDLGWGLTFLTGAFSFALLVAAVAGIGVGRWLDRHRPRPLFLAGALLGTAGAVAWATAASRWQFVLVWAVLGLCQSILFYGAAFTTLTKSFEGTERHHALTTVTLVAGLASTIFAPLTGVLEHAFGWRVAVLVLAGLLGGVTLPAFWLGLGGLRPGPSGQAATPAGSSSPAPSAVFRTQSFWTLTAAYLLSAGVTVAVLVHLVSYLRSTGLSGEVAASALGAIGLVQVLGRALYLRAGHRLRPVHLGSLAMLGKAAGLVLLLVTPGVFGVVLFIVVFGSANGATSLTQATSVAELYGALHFGSISGVLGSVTAAGAALAPVLAAGAIELAGREGPLFAGLVLLSLLAALLNQLAAARHRAELMSGSSGLSCET